MGFLLRSNVRGIEDVGVEGWFYRVVSSMSRAITHGLWKLVEMETHLREILSTESRSHEKRRVF